MLSRPHRIKDDDRNTRVDRAAFPRPQRDRIRSCRCATAAVQPPRRHRRDGLCHHYRLGDWYLARLEALLVQGEVESTRIDIAARVSGRLVKVPVSRGQDVAAGTTLLVIDNPELVVQLHEAEAGKLVADAELARINVGTRSEIIAQRKAENRPRCGRPLPRAADLQPYQAACRRKVRPSIEARSGHLLGGSQR
jgi:acetyl/propionyl-CoA carboxylase alpha subunit